MNLIKRVPLIDFITIKEIFRYTLKWKNPGIQKLILEKVDEAQHPQLLSAENLNLNKSILVDLVDVDDLEITRTVLSAVKNDRMFLYCNGEGHNPLLHAVANAKGFSVMETIVDGTQSFFLSQMMLFLSPS